MKDRGFMGGSSDSNSERKESLSTHEKVGGPLKKRFTAIVIASLIWPPDHHPVLIKTFDASR